MVLPCKQWWNTQYISGYATCDLAPMAIHLQSKKFADGQTWNRWGPTSYKKLQQEVGVIRPITVHYNYTAK